MRSLLDILNEINHGAIGWGVVAVIVLSLVQVSPIKINPWSFIAKHLGRALNAEIFERLDMEAAITSRVRILRFNDELLRDEKHTKEAFDQVLSDIDIYEAYCAAHPDFKNNKTKMSASYIIANYQEHMENRDFLVPYKRVKTED